MYSPIEVPKLMLDWSTMDLDVVDSLLLYIYTNRLNKSNLNGLAQAAEFFSIEDLQSRINEQRRISMLDVGSCFKRTTERLRIEVTHPGQSHLKKYQRVYKCTHCHLQFYSSATAASHLRRQHGTKLSKNQSGIRITITCRRCRRIYKTFQQWKSHFIDCKDLA